MYKIKTTIISVALLLVSTSTNAMAEGIDSLKKFYNSTQSISAKFHQVVTDTKGQKIQDVFGEMVIKRPNQFRWDYKKPFEQQLVSDGKQVWLYDIELAQVTTRQLSKALSASPAALLAGGEDLDKNFNLSNLSREDNLDWVSALSKDADSGFNNIAIAFKGDKLQQMELVDSFGHLTKIVFTDVKPNPNVSEKLFLFKAPKGVDVLVE
ncbi:MAG: outer membrane lipoprotein chaperone LolA [Methylotenera sp.]|nr:outer membrane lipoprotein chaperone LolA [Methylotenera sp.]HPH07818.1 outer membrane lipoprotein chaperone LolA [Methylotenera sp.]HPM48851.1 outer membrane lipoprotein chaperone LolA [Methylotenera sp.]HQM88255.1 outer membrane lipoprotein chaperone LolA [Methylotenera sp.]